MDTELSNTLDTIANEEGVQGVLVVDKAGLCLGVRGNASKFFAPFVASIASSAVNIQQMDDESKIEYPTITVEFNDKKIVVRPQETCTVAVFV
ncbi:hypothetical protein DM01DRAFT_1069999 [Hesseltinella vesiculosa]|uniref:Late endosomal/lysosomal adaptor and MAPK and MTOR activator 5 n=1 Tax=Hesseltinella vesiculosa TaxID=101127 RepID=A0A1X2GVC8_9FUNG|nr:hypothetical protein DM01DRAFT_1069999 [Hesseltinella vesiculosa]